MEMDSFSPFMAKKENAKKDFIFIFHKSIFGRIEKTSLAIIQKIKKYKNGFSPFMTKRKIQKRISFSFFINRFLGE